MRRGIGGVRVQFRGFILLAIELIGVSELGLHVGFRAAERIQSCDGCRIVSSLSIVAR